LSEGKAFTASAAVKQVAAFVFAIFPANGDIALTAKSVILA
jgi:N-methylhydantoinase B/oxoprolinase/acetone carboxylase alpha subunit